VSPSQRLVLGLIVLVTAAVGYVAGRELFLPRESTIQPIAFNHLKHTGELEIECSTCHEYFETGRHAGLPSLSTCLGCHEEPLTESPEELKISQLAESGEEDVFRKLFRLADHVFYSHRRHAMVANLACETCHGTIAKTETPPERPLIRIDMDFCLDCHDSSNISNDCTGCHH